MCCAPESLNNVLAFQNITGSLPGTKDFFAFFAHATDEMESNVPALLGWHQCDPVQAGQ